MFFFFCFQTAGKGLKKAANFYDPNLFPFQTAGKGLKKAANFYADLAHEAKRASDETLRINLKAKYVDIHTSST